MFSVIHSGTGRILSVLEIPKCGSSTLRYLQRSRVPSKDFLKLKNRIAFIREPINRIQKCYGFFCQSRRKLIPPDAVGNYKEFIDFTFETDDEHWRPQVSFLGGRESFIVNKIYKLEAMDRVLSEFLGFLPERQNQSEFSPIDPQYRISDLEEKYKEDLEVYNGLR